MAALRVGFITAAHVHYSAFLHGFRIHPDAEIAGIWDHDGERAEKIALQDGLARFGSLDELLSTCDAVVVLSETRLHVKYCRAAAKRGIHILCEKPLVTSEEEAVELRAAVEGSNIKFMTAFPCRYSPAFQRLKERVEAGDIGRIKAICGTNRGNDPGGWFDIEEFSGGGAMMDHTVHLADLYWLLLKEEPRSVEALIGNNVNGLDVDDTAVLTLQYDSGIFATLDASWSRPKKYKTWGDLTINVIGEKGMIEMDLFAQHLHVYDCGDPAHTVRGFGSEEYPKLAADFVRCIQNDLPSPISLEDGLRASRVTNAAYADSRAMLSAKKG